MALSSPCVEDSGFGAGQLNQLLWEPGASPYKEDDGLLVTHVNHTHDLLRVQGLRSTARGRMKSTTEWLEDHSVENSGLSLSHIFSLGTSTLTMIDTYHARMKWLTEGSLKAFGVVRGSRVGVVIDSSHAACEAGRLSQLQSDLQCLINEHLSHRKQLYAMSFGTEVSLLWDGPRDANSSRLREMCQWVQKLCPAGGCNLLNALRRVLQCRELDSLLLILGSCPDQTSDTLFDYVEQCTLGRELSILAVAYGSSSPVTIGIVKRLAEVTGGRFHIFSDMRQCMVDSSDMELIWGELQAARGVLGNLQEMRGGRVGETQVTVMQEVCAEVDSLCLTRLLPKSASQDAPLCLQSPGFLPSTSAEWLQSHGLKAQRLGVYQVLAPHAHSPLQEFVPILRKTVSSTVHQKAMVQFEWHDGTVKNVHVDPPLLYAYQKQLVSAVKVLEKRVAWLNTGSRQIWGTVCELRVLVLVDVSQWNSQYLRYIQLSLRLLLQEQMANKHSFNIIAFGGDVCAWQNEMVETSTKNLQEAWRWVQGLQCEGSRNMLAALRLAVENNLQGEPEHSQGLYLLTCGVPDQDMAAVEGYVSQCSGGGAWRLHVCLFGGVEPTALSCPFPPRYATQVETVDALRSLAHSTEGRFHCFRKSGIVESDDITALMAEIEKATRYWEKCSMLVDSVSHRTGCKGVSEAPMLEGKQPTVTMETWIPPRPTALTLARLQVKAQREEEASPVKALTWCPSKSPAQPASSRGPTGSGARHRKSSVSHSVFYTEEGNNLAKGFVFKKYPKAQSARRAIPKVTLPKEEEICSTKQWLKRFGVRKLKLDLDRLASGPDCTHHKSPASHVPVSAPDTPSLASCSPVLAYCRNIPLVDFNGTLRHLQLAPRELDQYLSQTGRLLRRYARRIQWLLSGSRRVFGVLLERDVCILLDCSGSMATSLPEVKRELSSLIWDQLRPNRHRFTLAAFSGEVQTWRPTLTEASEEACREAEQWVWQLCAHGGTCTLQAVQFACGLGDSVGVYMLSDGKPDSSCSLILQATERMSQGKHIIVHTISYNCNDSAANEFLRKLAHQTKGRFHCFQGDADLLVAAMLKEGSTEEAEPTCSAFEGDDLRGLAKEMDKLRHFRKQASAFRKILLEKQTPVKG
ncbi:von Willebrand factor A domain-containing protein 3A isoform X2 [Anguilla anguilla]|uniref:von Willebrand factor A domain-containing protein 3A isoform X2 n=1 Tax=Anguilla anguilla TaxID=7936 RepID=UPI0015A8E5E1|nr:von Willebrand factor A domain-containing protein 3A isoform X2 [Anguilla anguilla]